MLTGANGDYRANLTGPQGSGILTSLVRGNGLAVIPEDRYQVAAGEQVEVIVLEFDV
jgi:molybdopterin molybdotransferase